MEPPTRRNWRGEASAILRPEQPEMKDRECVSLRQRLFRASLKKPTVWQCVSFVRRVWGCVDNIVFFDVVCGETESCKDPNHWKQHSYPTGLPPSWGMKHLCYLT